VKCHPELTRSIASCLLVVSVGEKVVVVGTSKEVKKGKGWMVSPVSWLLRGERKKKEQEVVESQAKGTGYSSYQNKGWDVNAYMAAQKEKDKQIQLVLEKICIGRATT
jgi:hypothetical protein